MIQSFTLSKFFLFSVDVSSPKLISKKSNLKISAVLEIQANKKIWSSLSLNQANGTTQEAENQAKLIFFSTSIHPLCIVKDTFNLFLIP
jgi:hypothetical protein